MQAVLTFLPAQVGMKRITLKRHIMKSCFSGGPWNMMVDMMLRCGSTAWMQLQDNSSSNDPGHWTAEPGARNQKLASSMVTQALPTRTAQLRQYTSVLPLCTETNVVMKLKVDIGGGPVDACQMCHA